ncbi:cell wall-active antibiotics response protein LiaF [candidate division KSB1 bacterium]
MLRNFKHPILPGIILISLGLLFLLNSFFDYNFFSLVFSLWPLLLIWAGWSIISNARSGPKDQEFASGHGSAEYSNSDPDIRPADMKLVSILGSTSEKIFSKNFQGGSATSILGDVHLNFSEIDFEPGERSIYATSIIGDINITLPKNFGFAISSSTVIGDLKIFGQKAEGIFRSLNYRSENYDSAPKKIRLVTTLIIGDTFIR